MMPTRRALFRLATLALLPAAARADEPAVRVLQSWTRATPGAGRTAAIYLTLEAEGAADRLTGASSPDAAMAMLHESYTENGVARMRMLDGVDLPAGSKVVLKPGGMHIMLTGLRRTLRRGDKVEVTLTFASAPPIKVKVPVLAANTPSPAGETMPGMNGP